MIKYNSIRQHTIDLLLHTRCYANADDRTYPKMKYWLRK